MKARSDYVAERNKPVNVVTSRHRVDIYNITREQNPAKISSRFAIMMDNLGIKFSNEQGYNNLHIPESLTASVIIDFQRYISRRSGIDHSEKRKH